MGENPIMGQHENRGESRSSQMHLIIGRQSMRLCPSRHPSIKPDKLAMTLQTLLRDWRNGNQSALDRLTPLIYKDLIRLARARLKGERREFTLDPTALVHECYLRLADQTRLDVESRAHFYSIAANVMRRVLIDNARKRNAQKRNAGLRITLKTGIDFAEAPSLDAVLLDDALRKLADFDERKSQAITLKFFGGMTTEGIATALGISVATVGRELRLGQAWLRRELSTASV